jgi:hypothetical protein
MVDRPFDSAGTPSALLRRLVGDNDRISGVELQDGRVIRRVAVSVRPRLVASNEVLVALGCAMDDRGWAVTDAAGQTTRPWCLGGRQRSRSGVVLLRRQPLRAIGAGPALDREVQRSRPRRPTSAAWVVAFVMAQVLELMTRPLRQEGTAENIRRDRIARASAISAWPSPAVSRPP